MSFEERMALYKRKYNADASGADDPKAAGGKAPGKDRADRKNTGKAAPDKTAPKRAARQPQEQAAPQAATQEKKGVLSRLLGVFKKKPD